ncbi:MAG: chloride channel protein [Prevotella sp.]|nr:chloride channel protein [Prevotella sp.]
MASSIKETRFESFIRWREAHISDKSFIIFLALLVGVFASIAAYVLHSLIHVIQELLTLNVLKSELNWMYLVYPVIGILLTILFVKYFVKDQISHGITRVLYAISTKNSFIRAHNTWTSVVASSITIGFGGSVGAEAPIVLTGSSIGSTLGRLFHIDKKTLMVLVGCGAAAAIAGVFKAPIAGLVFTLEVLMIDLSMSSILPILISSVTATCFTYVLVGESSLFSYITVQPWGVERVPANILLGVFLGLVSLYFMRSMNACETLFSRIKKTRYRLLLGGVILSALIFLFPSLYGEGYSAVNILLSGADETGWETLMRGSLFHNHNSLIIYVLLVVVFKSVATASTNGAGGCGGTFAPSLVVGGFAGFLFSRVWNIYDLGIELSEANFTMLGMAGVLAGVMHAPLTGIFLIAELTGGYAMFMPLMIVCVVTVLTAGIFERHSIYAIRLAREGKLLTHHTDRSVLTLMNLNSVIEHDYTVFAPDMPLGKLVNRISEAQVGYFPVVGSDGALLGEVNMNKARHIIFRTELYSRFTVAQIMTPPAVTVGSGDPMADIMAKFEATNVEYIPVVDVNNILEGCISRTRVYSLYRKMVADYSDE